MPTEGTSKPVLCPTRFLRGASLAASTINRPLSYLLSLCTSVPGRRRVLLSTVCAATSAQDKSRCHLDSLWQTVLGLRGRDAGPTASALLGPGLWTQHHGHPALGCLPFLPSVPFPPDHFPCLEMRRWVSLLRSPAPHHHLQRSASGVFSIPSEWLPCCLSWCACGDLAELSHSS